MSVKDRFELPQDRLATADAEGHRIYLYPADVRGRYRSRRTALGFLLLAVFLVLPWIEIRGHPAILLDIAHRRFAFFGLGLWIHEAPLLLFVLGSAVIALALVTAIWGRLWCGWACPQTVFIDTVFRRIERWIEGDALARRKLDESPMNGEKFSKKALKWACFVLVSLQISHSFLAYFVGTAPLAQMIRSSPAENPGAFVFMAAMFLIVLFDFGWFREQFCTIVCPYGRFQSVLMDDRTQVVAYQGARGEPRRGSASPGQTEGDCVNCYRCVQVCPTGIDIRRGLQLECVACTACADACDEVMSRLKKPRGLIAYTKPRFSPRAWVYLSILIVLVSSFSFALAHRKRVDIDFIRAAEGPYATLASGAIINHFKLELRNQGFEMIEVSISPSSELKSQGAKLVVSNFSSQIAPGQAERADLFVEFPKAILSSGKAKARITVEITPEPGKSVERDTEEVQLVGPY